jgi:hypothetical protein
LKILVRGESKFSRAARYIEFGPSLAVKPNSPSFYDWPSRLDLALTCPALSFL